jgi:hypothetical protein
MGFLKNVEEIQKEEGIEPSIFAGIKYILKIDNV